MITGRLKEGGRLMEVQLYNGTFMSYHLSEATATTFCVNIFMVFNLRHGLISLLAECATQSIRKTFPDKLKPHIS